MAFFVHTRYGAQERYNDDANVASVVEDLLEELETEQFEEPDNEHTEVSVNHGQWGLSVNVSGLLTLGDYSWITGKESDIPLPTSHMRATNRADVAALMIKMARGDIDGVRSASWLPRDKLPPYTEDFFRGKSRA